MVAGERLIANDGYEVMLFPLPYMYITQGEFGTFSHAGILAIDFQGYGANGVILNAPLYAPCSMQCIAIFDTYNNGRIFQSLNMVHTPSGLKYINFIYFHDDNPIANVGDTFTQGDLFGHTGTAGHVTGDHVHFNFASGTYTGWQTVPPENKGQLINSAHIYNICYVNDTVLVEDYNYNWVRYTSPIQIKKTKFPWVLYARKLRSKY